MVDEVQISVRAYAKEVCVNESAIRRAIREGKINRGYDKVTKKIIRSIANKEYGNLKDIQTPQRGISKQKFAEKISKSARRGHGVDDITNGGPFDYSKLLDSISINATMEYKDIIKRRETVGLALDRMKLEEQNGILVRKADVEKNLFALGDQMKKGLLNIPNRVVDDIMAAPNKIEAINILTMEIQQMLERFAGMGEPQLTA